jgi:hypothetical protein
MRSARSRWSLQCSRPSACTMRRAAAAAARAQACLAARQVEEPAVPASPPTLLRLAQPAVLQRVLLGDGRRRLPVALDVRAQPTELCKHRARSASPQGDTQ